MSPSANKYVVLIMIFVGYAAYSYNRKAVSYVIPALIASGYGGDEIGLVLSSQNLAYTISKFFGGIIFDNISARNLFSGGLILGGLSALSFAGSNYLPVFVLSWFVNGLAQGLGWPAISRLLNKWCEPHELGTYWSLASSSTNAVGTVGPMIASYMLLNHSWQYSVIASGLAPLVIAQLCLVFVKDSPTSVVNTQLAAKPAKLKPKPLFDSFWTLLKSRPVIFIGFQYFVVSGLKTCVSDWGIFYLTETRKLPKSTADLFLSSLEFGGLVGGVASGVITDLIIRIYYQNTTPKVGNPRMMIASAFNLISIFVFYVFRELITPETGYSVITGTGLVLGAMIYGQITIYGIVATSAINKEKGGTAHAIVGLAANIGSVLAGLPFAYFANKFGWNVMQLVFNSIMIATFVLQVFTTYITYEVKLGKSKKS